MLVMSWGWTRSGALGRCRPPPRRPPRCWAGAILPLIAAILAGKQARIAVCVGVAAVMLILLGDLGARLGGAPRARAILRVTGWGLLAMGVTAGVGAIAGAVAGGLADVVTRGHVVLLALGRPHVGPVLARGKLDLLARDILVGEQAEQVVDELRRWCSCCRLHDVPGGLRVSVWANMSSLASE